MNDENGEPTLTGDTSGNIVADTTIEIRGRTLTLYGKWYIASSTCDTKDEYQGCASTSSVSCGKWHYGKKNNVIAQGCIKRFSFSLGNRVDRARAVKLAEKFIMDNYNKY